MAVIQPAAVLRHAVAPLDRARSLSRTVAVVGFVTVVGYLVVGPLVRVQQLALDDGAAGYERAADSPGLGNALITTAYLALGSLTIALVVGTALAWMSTRLPWRLRWLGIVPVLPIMAPAVATMIGWAFLLSPEAGYVNVLLRKLPFVNGTSGPIDVYSPSWIVTIVGFSLSAFVYLFVRAGLRNLNDELVEAAEVCGSSASAAFLRITLPLLRPVLVYGGSTALLLALGQVTAPLILGRRQGVDVLTTVMAQHTADAPPDYAAAAALGSPLVVVGLAIVVGQRLVLGNHARFVTHAGKGFRRSARPSGVAAIVLAAYGVISVVLPLGALALVALSPYWTPQLQFDRMGLDNFRQLAERTEIVSAVRNTVFLSVGAVLISLVVGFAAARIIHRRKRPALASVLDLFVNVPLGIPAVVYGAGFLFTYTRPPFELYGTTWVILLVYVTLMLPFATRFQLSALFALGTRYEEASWAAGGGVLRTAREIVLPLMRPALIGASTIMLVLLSHEFSASLLVRSVRTQVMGTQLYDYWTAGSYPLVAAFALAMCGITTLGVLIAMSVGGHDALERF